MASLGTAPVPVIARCSDSIGGSTWLMKTTVRLAAGADAPSRLSPVRAGVETPGPHAATSATSRIKARGQAFPISNLPNVGRQ
jgi:hypothetical protein